MKQRGRLKSAIMNSINALLGFKVGLQGQTAIRGRAQNRLRSRTGVGWGGGSVILGDGVFVNAKQLRWLCHQCCAEFPVPPRRGFRSSAIFRLDVLTCVGYD